MLLVTFWRSVGRLFLKCLSVHRVECCVALQHQQMFHPVTSFVSLVERVSANTCTFGSVTRSQFCIEVSSNNRYAFFFLQFVVCFSIVQYIFSTWWSAYPEWEKHALISLMHGWFATIAAVMARSLIYSVSIILCLHILFSIIPTPCLLSYFPAPMNMFVCCVSQISDLSGLHDEFKRLMFDLVIGGATTHFPTHSLEKGNRAFAPDRVHLNVRVSTVWSSLSVSGLWGDDSCSRRRDFMSKTCSTAPQRHLHRVQTERLQVSFWMWQTMEPPNKSPDAHERLPKSSETERWRTEATEHTATGVGQRSHWRLTSTHGFFDMCTARNDECRLGSLSGTWTALATQLP